MKPILKRVSPASELPYQSSNQAFRLRCLIPDDDSIEMRVDENGVAFIRTKNGESVGSLVAGDNISITRTDDGKVVISAVNTTTDIAAGNNVEIVIDPETGTAVINAIQSGITNEHYKGVFDTAEDLIEFDTEPEIGDYGMIKHITYSDGGETTWNGQYKYCFFINGQWTVVDQMLTFTKDADLLQQFYSVGGSSPVIYLHKIAQTGDFDDLNNIPIVATPEVTVNGDTVTVTCATEGAEIFYSTDGSMPHVNGTKYVGPITVAAATTFRFVGIKNGMINSLEAVASADYGLEAPVIELDWHDGTVTMTNPNIGGDIYYTTDGSTPTSGSTQYTEPFVINAATNFRAVVINGGVESPVNVVSFPIAPTPTIPTTGENWINGKAFFEISIPTVGETHYEYYPETPTYQSPVSSGRVNMDIYSENNPFRVTALTFAEGHVPSALFTSRELGYTKPDAPAVLFDVETNTVDFELVGNAKNVRLRTSVALKNTGGLIYYTLDGSTPTKQSTLYTGPFQISGNVTVKALLVAYDQNNSDVTTEDIIITDAPSITLDSETGFVTITGPAGASLYYTIDGSEPTTESTPYSAPFSIEGMGSSVTVKAIAFSDGQESAVATETWRALKWSGSYYFEVDLNTGVVSRGPRRAEDGSSISYAIVSGHGAPDSWSPYSSYVEYNYFDQNNPQAVWFRQTKQGYIPSNYGGTAYGQTTPDTPSITVDENTGLCTLALTGNTLDIPLQTNNNVPSVGARIWYTTDGSEPSDQNGTLWTGAPFVTERVGQIRAKTICYGEFESRTAVHDFIRYLTLTAEENGNIYMIAHFEDGTAPNIQYSINNGEWTNLSFAGSGTDKRSSDIPVSQGYFVKFKGENEYKDGHGRDYMSFRFTGRIAASGVPYCVFRGDGENYDETTSPVMSNLFNDSLYLTQAPELPATSLPAQAYQYLFSGCPWLTQAPTLPAMSVPSNGYYGMFEDCVRLTQAPQLPALNVGQYAYFNMFRGCFALVTPPNISATNVGDYAFWHMFQRCTSLTSSAEMVADRIGFCSCQEMYRDCTALVNARPLPATQLSESAYWLMFAGCTSLVNPPELPVTDFGYSRDCYESMFADCTSLAKAPNLPAAELQAGCYKNMFKGCRFLMSDDGSTFNFGFGATLPQTVDGVTYSTPRDVASWMGNLCGFDYMVPESALGDDTVAVVLKDNTTGVLKYTPYESYDGSKYFADQYTMKPFVRFTRGKNGKAVFMHKDQTSGMWAEFNRYRLACDTTAHGGFSWAVTINGSAKSGTVSWQAGDTLDSILAQMQSGAVAVYLVFSHVDGEEFIRIRKGGYSNSIFTLSNNTGATLTDLSLYTKIGDVQQAESHRDWQAQDVGTMFPSLGFLASNTAQYAVNGYNLSSICGGNETKYKAYYRTNGASSYLAESAISSRMSEAAFNALNGSGVAEQQELYDKYGGSWDAYMEASMIALDDTHTNGIEYQSYDNGDTQTSALASVTTMDFEGSYIPAFPCAAICQSFTDIDVINGKFNMITEHELGVFMRDAKMAAINSALDVLIAAGMTVAKLSATSYYYWSVARYYSYGAWFYYLDGRLNGNYLYYDLAARPLAYPVNS